MIENIREIVAQDIISRVSPDQSISNEKQAANTIIVPDSE